MPELPEVETIRRFLTSGTVDQPGILGAQIIRDDLIWPGSLATPAQEEFTRRITGSRILEITRRGKYLVLRLEDGYLLFHLRMSGDLILEPAEEEIAPHHRLVLYLAGGRRLAFNDTRKFGRAWLVSDPQQVTGKLGPEPLDPAFDARQFYDRLQKSHRQLKPLLMDQAFLAGLGNIYTDEALHRARLHPLTPSHTLDQAQAFVLYDAIQATLAAGIEHNGSSIDWVYRGGDFQNYFSVYDRKGQPCPVCGTLVEKIVVGQRGTHFCPACQPQPKEGER